MNIKNSNELIISNHFFLHWKTHHAETVRRRGRGVATPEQAYVLCRSKQVGG